MNQDLKLTLPFTFVHLNAIANSSFYIKTNPNQSYWINISERQKMTKYIKQKHTFTLLGKYWHNIGASIKDIASKGNEMGSKNVDMYRANFKM